MTRTLKNNVRLACRPAAILTLVLLAGAYGAASARATELLRMQGASFGSVGPTVGQPVFTPGGPAVVTGHLGSVATTTLPSSPGTGFLDNNGDGTSTLIVPGGPPQVFPTPR
jgi:hypothetical protein